MFSHSGHVMTLANSIIGVGILAMPFCFQKCGIILSIVLLILSNWITRICCHYLIKTSLLTRRKSFEMLGLHAFGTSGKLLAELCIIGYLIGTCITYFVVVGDLGPQIVAKLLGLEITEYQHLRTLVMFAITALCIVPLGMLRNVDSLSAVCTASIGFYVCLMLKIVLESESHIVANDWTEKVVYWEPAGVLQCLPIFSMALACQMQLFEVFGSINNQSLDKLNGIVRNATWICTLVYIAVGFFGYVAFCTHSFSGNILVNLSPSFGSDIIKIGFVLSIAFSFPLVIFPCRASIYSLLYKKGHMESSNYIPEQRFRVITLFIVFFSLCVALIIPSVELIIGLVGSTIGVAICIMFPASSFRQIIRKDSTERTLAQFVFVSGFCLMILGTYANLHAIDAQSSGPQFDAVQVVTPLLTNDIPPPVEVPNIQNSEVIKRLVKTNEAEVKEVLGKLEENKRVRAADNINLVEKPNVVIAVSDNPPMPPLPVDESHGMDSKNEAPPEKSESLPKEEPQPVAVAKDAKIVLKKNSTRAEDVVPVSVAPVKEEASHPMNIAAQQTIDGAAIKKEEEITAEEQKDKVMVVDLLKQEKELREKMERLGRTVDKLNEELAKQKPQSADTMKLLERSPQQQPQPQLQPQQQPQLQLQPQQEVNNTLRERKPASLLEILTENAHAREEQEAHAGVFEPLSYKTGELLRNASADAPPLAQRLPLPLALLANSTKARANSSVLAAQLTANKSIDADNVEAIRRELLQLKEQQMTTTAQPAIRVKRDADGNENCLPEPKLNEVKSGGLIGLTLQVENMGRELKSVNDDDLERTSSTPNTNTDDKRLTSALN
ncbi:PREDICTED: putative sodium-coupled neutral amino acid transporter 10 [Drosophila arizonae]|uniref:Sodium-coupled neutral amino acid transporter 10 n=1 Tax=Drosophila arizonae TaxID=7263 RepID=A0ABM1PIK9_DROAR|nr:PREDICTED: putative sodium-coupled neutral amino acid transporter 10 [Drosophila arizonae]